MEINIGSSFGCRTTSFNINAFNKTEEFLANIGDFSYRAAIRDLEKEPLNDQEYKTLQTLYSNAGNIQDELRKVQHLVLKTIYAGWMSRWHSHQIVILQTIQLLTD